MLRMLRPICNAITWNESEHLNTPKSHWQPDCTDTLSHSMLLIYVEDTPLLLLFPRATLAQQPMSHQDLYR